MRSVFVAHPVLQHAHQLALALHEHGLLQAFWSGIPVLNEDESGPFWITKKQRKRLKIVAIPAELRRHPVLFKILLSAGKFLPRSFSQEDYSHRIYHLFDWWVARQLSRLKPAVVVAYENSAYHTFRAAKAIGAKCILDAPSLQHQAGANLMKVEQTPYLAEINRRKDAEAELADLILTCSPLAAEGYIEAGIPADRVRPVLLGASPPGNLPSWQPHDNPLRFVFAGALSYRKAIDIILRVFGRLHEEGLPCRIDFVGGEGEPGWVEAINQLPNATYSGNVAQADLFKKLALADCLLLPSRFDSFGMVVAEAMSCGTPAIVSTQTGAKAMIEQFPGSGWIVEADEDSLYRCLRERIQNREQLFAARERAFEASKHFTWQAYRMRIGNLIKDWM